MNQGYFIQYGLELLGGDLKSEMNHFEKISDILLALYISRIDNKQTNFHGERLHYINLITQKFLLHINSVKKLTDGITLKSKSKDFETIVKDPFSISVLVRGSIENYLVLNYISNRFKDEDLLSGRFEIWLRYGLTKRGVLPENDEERRVNQSDKDSIELLTERIINRNFFKNLSEQKQETFLKQINREWKFTFKDDKFFPASWKDLIYDSGLKSHIGQNVYNYLSWHAHTQSISVIQLKDMWNENFDEFSTKVSISKLNMFGSFLISDIIQNDSEFKNAFNSMSEDLRELINFYNYSYRGDEFLI
ncbi:hypothetical protein [Marinirhabdus gelatinilytica]|uniref:Uncharacterized protein n=1 Tax=Marinirhabdus gelatinilytica TaxID=1703343 RepID=A0A370QF25_9FLAO|nr:hypothetical protein [Marinirhabdus gelatinilytica]RDK86976.1 hypothetical protein C8D94_102154 [Marinirhabdus gelatinilytica]